MAKWFDFPEELRHMILKYIFANRKFVYFGCCNIPDKLQAAFDVLRVSRAFVTAPEARLALLESATINVQGIAIFNVKDPSLGPEYLHPIKRLSLDFSSLPVCEGSLTPAALRKDFPNLKAVKIVIQSVEPLLSLEEPLNSANSLGTLYDEKEKADDFLVPSRCDRALVKSLLNADVLDKMRSFRDYFTSGVQRKTTYTFLEQSKTHGLVTELQFPVKIACGRSDTWIRSAYVLNVTFTTNDWSIRYKYGAQEVVVPQTKQQTF